jgi:hypothetical protein
LTESLIHLRVPAAVKSRWIRASRAAGMRLTDWITQAVEARMQQLTKMTVSIPDGLDFSALRLARDPDGHVSFDWTPVERICAESGIDVAIFRDAPEDNVAGLIAAWYAEHLRRGGSRDPVQDDLIAETLAEERIGQSVSLPPGRA